MTAVATNLTPSQVQMLIVSRLTALRDALDNLQDLYRWTSGLAVSDMETAAGVSANDAPIWLAACADANAEAQMHNTGLPPNTYPQPASAYVYGASQAQIIGPQ
jgi:hypothetical protein